jgi:MFS transporter, putative metabolite:H+ symporter
MSSIDSNQTDPQYPLRKKWFLATLAIAMFSTGLANSILALFATDMANTFFGSGVTIGVASVTQLSTINMAGEVIGAIVLSILAIKFRHKRLLFAGTIFIVISAVGSYLAPNLLTLQLCYALEGVGSVVISVIAMSLIADSLPAAQRAKVIGYLFSIGAAVTLAMIPAVGLITEMGGWRLGFATLAFPISLIGLFLALFLVPNPKRLEQSPAVKRNPYVEGFRQIIKNRSAAACLIANLLTVAGTEVAIFAIAFYRIQFGATRGETVLIYEFSIILFILAPLVSSRLVTRFGAKPIALITTFLAACFTGIFFFVPNMWLALTLDMMHVWFAAMAIPAFAVLILEQLPKYRATLFSLNSFFNNIGKVLAPLIGGVLLVFSSGIYGMVGFVLGGMTIIGCLVLFFAVKDSRDI